MTGVLSARLEAILPGGRGVWVPMDHSASAFPESGLEDTDSSVDSAIEGGADAIILHKGALSYHSRRTGWNRFVCHTSVSTSHGGDRSNDKVVVATVSECLDRGAIGVSAQVNLGDPAEPEMIERIGSITTESQKHETPVLGMFYPRGPNLTLDPADSTVGVAHAARLAWEVGCNVVKVPWTGSEESFRIVTSSVPIPVLVSGGQRKASFMEILEIVEKSINAGGSGVCIGRHVFAADDPASHIRALRAMVHDGANPEEASRHLG
ncbi:MAG: fructose-bisphosphate aldolase [Euryarchaeota archaeon]|nr:fructose-bisphosphate aldolase [Euryarchaeota archaeon]|tara:strand:+ start:904 stop:1698 length:795 start_codon:yes stop_codon:yes gene_type:complete